MENKLQKVQAFLSKIEGEGLMTEQQAFVIQAEQEMFGGVNRKCTNSSTACEDTNFGCKNGNSWCNKQSDNEECVNLPELNKNGLIGCEVNSGCTNSVC